MTNSFLAATLALALVAGGQSARAGGDDGESGGSGGGPDWFPVPTQCPPEPDWGGLLKRVKDDADFYKRYSKAVSAVADYVKSKIPIDGKDEAELAAKLGDALFGPCK